MLKLLARKEIIDQCVCCPGIFGKTMAPKMTKKGMVENGMLDAKTHTYPDITMLLRTCKSEVKQEHVNLIFSHFSELYSIMKNEGHITEEVYDRMGFPTDTNYSGTEVKKPDTISQETRHCAKILSHSPQRDFRQRKENDVLTAKRKKENYHLVGQNGIHERNDAAAQ